MPRASPKIIVYTTSLPTTHKIRADVERLGALLAALALKIGIEYETVDLTQTPHRRSEMLLASDGNSVLPQLHVDGKFVGSCDDVQEMEDFGELRPILLGETPAPQA
ncbi:unnamed protein product [Pedinophyceae sp. YPF-701]|nr:unnamed protein product [Pedinophyceae sp. YPF-701]